MRYASKTNIKISSHAMQRIKERTEFSVKNDIYNYISKARYYGVHVDQLSIDNYQKFNIPENLFIHLKKNFYYFYSDKIILYRDTILCFTGHKDRTLKTIISVPNKYKGWWK